MVTLDAGARYSAYLWSPGGETTRTIEVTIGGNYSVVVTDANGYQGGGDIDVIRSLHRLQHQRPDDTFVLVGKTASDPRNVF